MIGSVMRMTNFVFAKGVWLRKWLEHVETYQMQSNENKGLKKKAYFYGGHDINIAGILMTLGIFYPHLPNYASAVNFELHEDDSQQFYVKVCKSPRLATNTVTNND